MLSLSSLVVVASGFLSAQALDVSVSTAESGLVATAWYASWHNEAYPLSDVAWDKYTHMTYAFAETTPDPSKLSFAEDSPAELLDDFVQAAHDNNVKALVSIGGWTGSIYWSNAVGTAENRTTFVKTLVDFAKEHSLDGLDFDWEYPNNQGLGCNTISPDDTANYLEFLKELRADEFGADLILTAATSISPFMNADSEPSADVSAFAEHLTWVALMNYDLWGSWSETVGPNAPLNDTCAPEASQQGSAVAAVTAWNAAGIPYNQLVLGVASYGHSFAVNASSAYPDGDDGELALYPTFDATVHRQGDEWDDAPGKDACGAEQNWGGNYNFWALVDAGYLDESGEPKTETAYVYDECTQTPFVYDAASELMIAYDDPKSFKAKGQFVKDTGLAGFAMWEAAGDYKTVLLDAILETAA